MEALFAYPADVALYDIFRIAAGQWKSEMNLNSIGYQALSIIIVRQRSVVPAGMLASNIGHAGPTAVSARYLLTESAAAQLTAILVIFGG